MFLTTSGHMFSVWSESCCDWLVRLWRSTCSGDEGRGTHSWGSLQGQLFQADFYMFICISPTSLELNHENTLSSGAVPDALHSGIQYVRSLNLLIIRIYTPSNELISHSDKLFSGSYSFSISSIFSWWISICVENFKLQSAQSIIFKYIL